MGKKKSILFSWSLVFLFFFKSERDSLGGIIFKVENSGDGIKFSDWNREIIGLYVSVVSFCLEIAHVAFSFPSL